jgi:hypothetical protein
VLLLLLLLLCGLCGAVPGRMSHGVRRSDGEPVQRVCYGKGEEGSETVYLSSQPASQPASRGTIVLAPPPVFFSSLDKNSKKSLLPHENSH